MPCLLLWAAIDKRPARPATLAEHAPAGSAFMRDASTQAVIASSAVPNWSKFQPGELAAGARATRAGGRRRVVHKAATSQALWLPGHQREGLAQSAKLAIAVTPPYP